MNLEEAAARPAAESFLRTLAAGMLAAFALVAALYLARGFFVPLLIGILASYALNPLVNALSAGRVPRSIGAALVLALVIGSISWIGVSLSDDVGAVIEKLPAAARKLRKELGTARLGASNAMHSMQEAAHELEGAAAEAGGKQKSRSTAVEPPSPAPTWLHDYAMAQYALLVSLAGQAPVVLLLTYFLLASGGHFRRKLLQLVGPSRARKKDATHILDEIDAQVQRYLLVSLVSNTLLAVATWLAFLALGLEQAGAWGAAAGVLHFVPYLGPALTALGSGVAALMQTGSLLYAVSVAGVSLLIAGLIGFAFMMWLQSRFARVNAAVLFIALLFFGWLWGVAGLLLGAPLVAITKAICDRVEALKPAGELLGR